MTQIRIHGRGGQGVVTAAELIAIAGYQQGLQAQAFPFFGVERRGAPISSFVRLDTEPIISKERIYNPDILLILDFTLLSGHSDIYSGIHKDTIVIVNAPLDYQFKQKLVTKKIYFSPASTIAQEVFGKNITNTVMLGALVKYSQVVSLEAIKFAIKEKFREKGKELINKNIEAIERASV